MRRSGLVCTAGAAILIITSACSSANTITPSTTIFAPAKPMPAILPTPSDPGSFQWTKCRFVLPEDLSEGEDVECGYLAVREQRSDDQASSNERVIQLAVAIFHPPGGATMPDPLIYLAGGPGASILELLRYQFEVLSEPAFATGRDLVLFDQRGVGLSRPALDCPEFKDLAKDLLDRQIDGRQVDEDEGSVLFLETLQECREGLSEEADLSAYHSAASAADVADLLQALDYEQVNLWGGSYGTRLALEVMRRYPLGIRSVVLDAVYPPDVDLYLEAPGNFERALDRLFEACAANKVCNESYPDLQQVFYETVAQLNEEPLLREVEDPFTGESYQTWMDGNTILALTFQLLYDSKLRYLLPGQIYAAHQSDYRAFDLARASLLRLENVSSRGMMFSVQCHDELAFSSFEDYQAEVANYPHLTELYTNSILGGLAYRVCRIWEAGNAEASANQPVSSAIPTLIMTGEFDPITPPAWGQHAAKSLENVFYYEYPGVGHGAGGLEGCPRQMMVAFLSDPTVPPGAECITEMIRE